MWDCLFYEGSKIIFRVGLMLVEHYRNEMLACEDITALAKCFKLIIQRPFTLNCHIFIKVLVLFLYNICIYHVYHVQFSFMLENV